MYNATWNDNPIKFQNISPYNVRGKILSFLSCTSSQLTTSVHKRQYCVRALLGGTDVVVVRNTVTGGNPTLPVKWSGVGLLLDYICLYARVTSISAPISRQQCLVNKEDLQRDRNLSRLKAQYLFLKSLSICFKKLHELKYFNCFAYKSIWFI